MANGAARQQRTTQGHVDKRWQEDAHRGDQAAGQTAVTVLVAEDVANEGGRREEGARRHLPDSNRIEQLLVGKPVIVLDQVGPEERQQDVAAAVYHRAHFQKDEEQPSQAERHRSRGQGRRGGQEQMPWTFAGSSKAEEASPGASHEPGSEKHGHRIDTQQGQEDPSDYHPGQERFAYHDAGQTEEGLHHHGDDDRLGSVQQTRGRRQLAEANIDPGEGRDDQGGRQDEQVPATTRPAQPPRR